MFDENIKICFWDDAIGDTVYTQIHAKSKIHVYVHVWILVVSFHSSYSYTSELYHMVRGGSYIFMVKISPRDQWAVQLAFWGCNKELYESVFLRSFDALHCV